MSWKRLLLLESGSQFGYDDTIVSKTVIFDEAYLSTEASNTATSLINNNKVEEKNISSYILIKNKEAGGHRI